MMGWLTDWLPRIVARAPATVRTKLLAAFLSIVVLLITVGAVGLEVLTRVERHAEETNSRYARMMLHDWSRSLPRFWQVVPKDYVKYLPVPLTAAEPEALRA